MSFNSSSSGNKPKLGTIKLGDLKVKPIGGNGFLKTNFQVNGFDKMKSQNENTGFNGGFDRGFKKTANQVEQKRQFGNFDISSFLEKNKVDYDNESSNGAKTSQQKIKDNQKQEADSASNIDKNVAQFRKMSFHFADDDNTPQNKQKVSLNGKSEFKQAEHNGNNGFFKKRGENFAYKNNGFGNRGGQYNRFEKNGSNFNSNFKNKDNRFDGKNDRKGFSNGQGFRFKSNQVSIKRNLDQKKDNNNSTSFKRSSHGSSVDKYSINGMLKTMTNDIELDTEMDEVLGNVISVKLSGINTSNALKKKKKTRTAS